MKPEVWHGAATATFPSAEDLQQMDAVFLCMMVCLPGPGLSDGARRSWKNTFDAVFELVYPSQSSQNDYPGFTG